NKRAVENKLRIKDANGTTVFEKLTMSNETQYNDTLDLPLGCYTLVLDDAGNNGLSWWAASSAGNGSFSIRNASTGAALKTFNPDFGAQVFYSFTIGFSLKLDEHNFDNNVTVYPNPNNGRFTVQMQGFNGKISLELTNTIGQSLWND